MYIISWGLSLGKFSRTGLCERCKVITESGTVSQASEAFGLGVVRGLIYGDLG